MSGAIPLIPPPPYANFILFIQCVFFQSMYPQTSELKEIQFITIIRTPTCFGTVPKHVGVLLL